MSEKELEERRDMLECYLRCLCQNPYIVTSPLISNFFRDAQKETFLNEYDDDIETQLAIYFLDGTKSLIHCTPGDGTSVILKRLADKIGVGSYIIKQFGLFIVAKSDINQFKAIRWLQDIECPSISLHTASASLPKKTLKIVIRKNYWDREVDKTLCQDRSAVNLLYIQALAEVDSWKYHSKIFESNSVHMWTPPSQEFCTKLRKLQEERSFFEALKHCQAHPRYGLFYFEECASDYPVQNTKTRLAVGNRQIFLLYQIHGSGPYVESSFKVNRIRGWKLQHEDKNGTQPRLSWEYLMSQDNLKWITVFGEQSLLLSLCLQSMVSEIVKSRDAFAKDNPVSNVRSTVTSADLTSTPSSTRSSIDESFLTTTPGSKTSRSKSISSSFDNDAFSTITDDDL